MMKKISLTVSLLTACVLFSGSLAASDIASICNGKSRTLASGTVIEGVVVSDFRSANNALNPNVKWDRIDYANSHRTAYVENVDGSRGVRVIFSTQYLTSFERGSLVSIDVSNCRLEVNRNPECYTVTGVDPKNVSVKQTGLTPAVKVRTLSELTDADIFTQVTLSGLEFLSKQGSFSNVWETCTKDMPINNMKVDRHLGAADGWAQLLEDKDGRSIYMQVNSLCRWRRNNIGVPAGVGDVTGVLVCENNPRYGGSFGKWSIRPLFREDIDIPARRATSFTTIASWTWDRNYRQSLNLRDGGLKEWVDKEGISGAVILAEQGNGVLYTDSGCSISPALEYDTRWCTDNSGNAARKAGSICFKGNTASWLHPGSANSAIIIETSTKGVSGKGLLLNFSFLAGEGSYASSGGIPAEWTVEYSTDGVKYEPTGFTALLRPLVWPAVFDKALGMIPPSYSAAMGFSEYSVSLPASLLGQEKLFVRIIPSSIVVTKAVADPGAELCRDKFNGENNNDIKICLGMAAIKAF